MLNFSINASSAPVARVIPRDIRLRLDEFTDQLEAKGAFTTDPIKYIQTHYDGDKKLGLKQGTTYTLWSILKGTPLEYSSPPNMHRALRGIGIKFRPGATDEGRNRLQEIRNREKEDRYQKFLNELQALKGSPLMDTSHFDQGVFAALTYKKDRVLHVLGVDAQDIAVISERTGLGTDALKTSINMALKKILPNINGLDITDVTPSKGTVANIIKQKKHK